MSLDIKDVDTERERCSVLHSLGMHTMVILRDSSRTYTITTIGLSELRESKRSYLQNATTVTRSMNIAACLIKCSYQQTNFV